jgi:hypothetical protein
MRCEVRWTYGHGGLFSEEQKVKAWIIRDLAQHFRPRKVEARHPEVAWQRLAALLLSDRASGARKGAISITRAQFQLQQEAKGEKEEGKKAREKEKETNSYVRRKRRPFRRSILSEPNPFATRYVGRVS